MVVTRSGYYDNTPTRRSGWGCCFTVPPTKVTLGSAYHEGHAVTVTAFDVADAPVRPVFDAVTTELRV